MAAPGVGLPRKDPAVCRGSVEGKANSERVGNSRNRYNTANLLMNNAPTFWANLSALTNQVPNQPNRQLVDCAEPNVVAKLVYLYGAAELPNIRVQLTAQEGEVYDLCENCRQWLSVTSIPRVYKINSDMLVNGAAPAPPSGFNAIDLSKFPPLPGKEK